MKQLKCLENFTISKTNYYLEEEMKTINIAMLKERGVTLQDLSILTYNAQSKYLPSLNLNECEVAVLQTLSKREVFHSLLLAINLDMCAEKHLFDEPLNSILLSDLGLFGCDEALALQISNVHGTIGTTNYGYLDVSKPGIIYLLQNHKEHCHCFLDDLIGAIAAASAISIAQSYANKNN